MSFILPLMSSSSGTSGDWQAVNNPYVRPADWLALPTLTSGEQKIVLLHAVYNHGSNFCAFSCTTAYTVDWGDGTTTNHATGTTALKNFSYASYSNLTTRGYRQAIVTITPQSGQNLTSINLNVKHTQANLPVYGTGWLDMKVVGSGFSSLIVGGSNVLQNSLEMFEFIGANVITSFGNCFLNCKLLQKIVQLHTGNATTLANMHQNCVSLETIPVYNTALVTNYTSFLQGCTSFRAMPLLDTSAGITFTNMFFSCISLQNLPLLVTSAGTNFSSFVNGCYSLIEFPLINTANGTNFNSMFLDCRSLQTLPVLNTAKGTGFGSLVQGCLSLREFPVINTILGTDFSNLCNGCLTIKSFPAINTSAGTSFGGMFFGCVTLENVGAIDVANAASFASFFQGCASLAKVSMINIKKTLTIAAFKFGQAELVEVFNNLATVSGQTLTVTTNWGVASLTTTEKAIATDKGWVLTL